MITLITGLPGAGKTLNTLQLVHKEAGEDRPIYYAGIKELQLPWQERSYADLEDWQSFPDNAVFVIDEAQRWVPQRGNSPHLPDWIRDLAEHRHRGFDFYLITQRPKGIDHYVRELAGRHVHFERQYNREASRRLEWPRCVADPTDFHARQEAEKTRVKFDKKWYHAYKSAEAHTHAPRIPRKVWYVLALVVVVAGFGVSFAMDIRSRMNGDQELVADGSNNDDFQPLEELRPFAQGEVYRGQDEVMSREAYIRQFVPRIASFPHTAPVYDEVTKVQTFPRPQCIYSHRTGRCQCYSQQATPMQVEYPVCRDIVANGWFNPYQEDRREAVASGEAGEAPPADAAPNPANEPRIVYLGGDKNSQPAVLGPDEFESERLSIDQPGRAFRNPRSVPTQPSAPGVSGSRR
jgi:zona occludens toxin